MCPYIYKNISKIKKKRNPYISVGVDPRILSKGECLR
jgi:hypothetical protein